MLNAGIKTNTFIQNCIYLTNYILMRLPPGGCKHAYQNYWFVSSNHIFIEASNNYISKNSYNYQARN